MGTAQFVRVSHGNCVIRIVSRTMRCWNVENLGVMLILILVENDLLDSGVLCYQGDWPLVCIR